VKQKILFVVLTHQVASLKRQLEFSQTQVSELQQAAGDDVKVCCETLDVQQDSHVRQFICGFDFLQPKLSITKVYFFQLITNEK